VRRLLIIENQRVSLFKYSVHPVNIKAIDGGKIDGTRKTDEREMIIEEKLMKER